jgi:hypothetical protein
MECQAARAGGDALRRRAHWSRRCRAFGPRWATVGNMAPEYGATMGVDEETLAYLRVTGGSDELCETFENYYKAQCLWGYRARAAYERKQAAATLRQANEQLHCFSRRLFQVQEDERRHRAREHMQKVPPVPIRPSSVR